MTRVGGVHPGMKRVTDSMMTVILVIHLLIALALVGVILLQRSEGGALGIGGSGNSFMSGRAAGNALTRLTAILAVAFFSTSMVLAVLAGQGREDTSILDTPGLEEGVQPTPLDQKMPNVPQVPVAD